MTNRTRLDKNLIRTYEEMDYIVDDDPPLVLRVNEQNDGLRVLLASFGVESAAFVTAWNPCERAVAMEENYDRQMELLAAIENMRLNYFVGTAQHPSKDWREENYLVLGITRESARRLAADFDQARFVWLDMRGMPELVLLHQAQKEGPE